MNINFQSETHAYRHADNPNIIVLSGNGDPDVFIDVRKISMISKPFGSWIGDIPVSVIGAVIDGDDVFIKVRRGYAENLFDELYKLWNNVVYDE